MCVGDETGSGGKERRCWKNRDERDAERRDRTNEMKGGSKFYCDVNGGIHSKSHHSRRVSPPLLLLNPPLRYCITLSTQDFPLQMSKVTPMRSPQAYVERGSHERT